MFINVQNKLRRALCDGALMFAMAGGTGCLMEAEAPEDDEDEGEGDLDAADELVEAPPKPADIVIGEPGSSEFGCCSQHPGSGCNDAIIESCVCGLDSACCTGAWDETCVMEARSLCNSCQ
jgi:hypothetical protein